MDEDVKRTVVVAKLEFIKDETEYIRESLNRICDEVDNLRDILQVRDWDAER